MGLFKGRLMHSKYFQEPNEFRDKSVVCMGLGPSCADLCLKLGPVAKEVVACHRFPGGFSLGILPPNVRETVNVKRLTEHSVVTEENEDIPCDVLILCTGYKPYHPFLKTALLKSSNNAPIINNLYKKMFVPHYPKLCFINAHGIAEEFLVMEIQAKYFVSMLEGKFNLPTLSAMEKFATQETNCDNKSQAKLSESLHSEQYAMKGVQDYLQGLAREGGFEQDFKCIPLHLTMWQWVIRRIFGSLALYRSDKLIVHASNLWEYRYASGNEKELKIRTFYLKTDGSVQSKEEQRELQ